MKEKTAIFPYDQDVSYILESLNTSLYDIRHVINLENDISKLENSDLLCSENEFMDNNFINNIDSIILNNSKKFSDKQIFIDIINVAISKGKSIRLLEDLSKEYNNLSYDLLEEQQAVIRESYEIGIPVIMVSGLGENCEKMNIQVDLQKFFNNKGYKTSWIASNNAGSIIGANVIPGFIYDDEFDFNEKVYKFQQYAKEVVKKGKADVLIIGIPGAPMIFNKFIHNNYGYLHYLITSAVTPDICILSLYAGKYSNEYLQELKKTYYYKFGMRVNYFNICKKVCQYSPESKGLEFYNVDREFLLNNCVDYSENEEDSFVFSMEDARGKDQVLHSILNELQNNIALV